MHDSLGFLFVGGIVPFMGVHLARDKSHWLGSISLILPAKAPQVKLLPAISADASDAEDAAAADAKAPPPAGATILVQRWTANEKRLRVSALGPVRVALRLLNYPAWRVEVNGARFTPEKAGDTDQMVVALPAGASEVSVTFARTWDRTVGGGLSLISLGLAWVLLIRPKRT